MNEKSAHRRMELAPNQPVRFLLDINETLIRTGAISEDDHIHDVQTLRKLVKVFRQIGEMQGELEIVFVTGNSFEYSRRIEEPLGLKHLPHTSVIIVSENGLVARSFARGAMWKCKPLPEYLQACDELLQIVERDPQLKQKWYSQGNEVRLTLKPVANEFTAPERARLTDLCDRFTEVWDIYVHRFYVDLDPKRVVLNSEVMDFFGKASAVRRVLSADSRNWLNVAIGDSASDIPMFEAVTEANGLCFWVQNTRAAQSFELAEVLPEAFGLGVLDVSRRVLAACHWSST